MLSGIALMDRPPYNAFARLSKKRKVVYPPGMLDEWQDSPEYAQQRVGTVLKGSWKLLETLGLGASAWVYVAEGPDRQRVAVKVLHGPLVPTQVKSRFVREARIANAIGHRGVVKVLDDGECPDGSPFLVMELLEGETLEHRARRKGGRLPVPEVMWAADQLLDILGAAHKKGVVHRDIKPENVFVTVEHKIKLLDFGIARLRDHLQSEDTRVGTLLGTLDFMPPEQARGDVDNVGVQADLWSVGATMFRLLSGHLVHEEERMIEQIRAAMTKPAPPLRSVAPHVPEQIALLVDFALMYDAPQRWPNARAMRNALIVANASIQVTDDAPLSDLSRSSAGIIISAPEVPPLSLRRPPAR